MPRPMPLVESGINATHVFKVPYLTSGEIKHELLCMGLHVYDDISTDEYPTERFEFSSSLIQRTAHEHIL